MTDGLESASLRISEASAPWSCPASRISTKRAMRGSPSDKVLHRIDAGALPAYCGGLGNLGLSSGGVEVMRTLA